MDTLKLTACKLYSIIVISLLISFLLGYGFSSIGKLRPRHRSYLILFPSNGNEIFLERCNTMNYYWELPGGGEKVEGEAGDKDFGSRFRTMQREWREETGTNLPGFDRHIIFQIDNRYYFTASTNQTLELPADHRLYGDGEMDEWRLVKVEDVFDLDLRADTREALEKALNDGYISKNGINF